MTAPSVVSVATVAVAFSGGRDSLALLHATCHAASGLGLQVVALHVHHGLMPEADGWVRWAQRLCGRWRRRGWPLRLRWQRLDGAPGAGDSLEAWARAGRYAALRQLAQQEGADLLLLAQHQRDQAETVLLQALRGGGPAGLSAMPRTALRQGLTWVRPWLDQPREAIDAYICQHRLRPLEDPSNNDLRLARNRLRLQVWPSLLAAFADAEVALAGAARRAQEARAALAELAALDLAPLEDGAGHLDVLGWRCLSAARQANALRAWWQGGTGRALSDVSVHRLLAEVTPGGAARWPTGAGWWCVQYRGHLSSLAESAAPVRMPLRPAALMAAGSATPAPVWLDLSRPGRWPVPGWAGIIEVIVGPQAANVGLLQRLQVRPRSGGERFQHAPRSLPRSLKKQFQAAAVPEHNRAGPLLWSAGQLLFVPGLGVDARCWSASNEPGLTLRWCPDLALSAPPKPAG
jgi:tRNA(Ile)-lysidine synthase